MTVSVVGGMLALRPTTAAPPGAALDLTRLEGGAKVTALIEGVVAQQRSLQSLRADFVQLKSSAMLLEPVRSTGEFCYLAPDRVRWDYHQPEAMVVLFTDDFVTTYYPGHHQAEQVKVSGHDRRFVRVLAGTLPMDDLTSYFRIRLEDPGPPGPYRLRLTPHRKSLSKRLDSLQLEVDRDLLLPVVVEYIEADGDRTRYEFSRLERDPVLEVSRFRLELGPGVTLHTIDASAGLG